MLRKNSTSKQGNPGLAILLLVVVAVLGSQVRSEPTLSEESLRDELRRELRGDMDAEVLAVQVSHNISNRIVLRLQATAEQHAKASAIDVRKLATRTTPAGRRP